MPTRTHALACLLALAACTPAPRDPSADGPRATLVLRVGDHEARVAVARRREVRRRGLQGVRALGPDEGMLFLYREAGARTMWMKGCLVALDVAFLDAEGVVQEVVTLHPPRSAGVRPARARSRAPSKMVLEMPGGWFARKGIGAGARVRMPRHLDLEDADP